MDITINGSPADITLEAEKNVGDVLSAINDWLSGSGNRLSGLSIDGEEVGSDIFAEAFNREIKDIASLNLVISSWADLALEVFRRLRDFADLLEGASFGDRDAIRRKWEGDPAAQFLAEEIPDFFASVSRSFRGEGLSPRELIILIDERLRELEDPFLELENVETLVAAIARRLTELPLDIQTGKDGRAAETIQIFSRIAEKLFRLLGILTREGLLAETPLIDGRPFRNFTEDFGAALGELSAAYESYDAVLLGDLAEYELAPRLSKLYGALKPGGESC
jgi:hypothetical protein